MSEDRALEVVKATYVPALAISVEQALTNYRAFQDFKRQILKKGIDYDAIPGTSKDTLLKPGAEKLCNAFALSAETPIVKRTEDWERGFFDFEAECRLTHRATGTLVATCTGSANSMEARYRWRWVPEHQVPLGLDKSTLAQQGGKTTEPDFAIERAATGGKWGKPASYWQAFRDAIQAGTARKGSRADKNGRDMATWEIDTTVYRIPNDDPYTLKNTLQKMAQKRAFVGATLLATNASDSFTQDMEDFVEGEVVHVSDTPSPTPQPAERTEAPAAEAAYSCNDMYEWLTEKHDMADEPAKALAELYYHMGVSRADGWVRGGKAVKTYNRDKDAFLDSVNQALREAKAKAEAAAQQSGK